MWNLKELNAWDGEWGGGCQEQRGGGVGGCWAKGTDFRLNMSKFWDLMCCMVTTWYRTVYFKVAKSVSKYQDTHTQNKII